MRRHGRHGFGWQMRGDGFARRLMKIQVRFAAETDP